MILVADNFQITNREIEQSIKKINPGPIEKLIKDCESQGARAIDVNIGPLHKHPEKTMEFIIETIENVTNLPLFIDTSNPIAIRAGLSTGKNKKIINGFSLEPAKLKYILPLAKEFSVDIIGYLLYPNSHVPKTEDEKLSIATELLNEVKKADINPERLIIDPVIPPLIWDDGPSQAFATLSVIKNLPDLLDFPIKTIGGVSNLTTGKGPFDKKLLLEKTYLPMLAASGLSFALLNIFHKQTVIMAKVSDIICSGEIFTWDII